MSLYPWKTALLRASFLHNSPYSYWLALVIGPNTLCICVTFSTLSFLFYLEDRGSTFLQNASEYLPDYTVSHPIVITVRTLHLTSSYGNWLLNYNALK
jgi:hypothetical protein